MLKQIVLTEESKVGSLINSEPFFLLEEELELEFIGKRGEDTLLVLVRNGDKVKQILVQGSSLVVPKELLKEEGTLETVVNTYRNGELMFKWDCQPITLIKLEDDTFAGYPQITILQDKIAELQAEIHFLKERIKDLQLQINRVWEIEES